MKAWCCLEPGAGLRADSATYCRISSLAGMATAPSASLKRKPPLKSASTCCLVSTMLFRSFYSCENYCILRAMSASLCWAWSFSCSIWARELRLFAEAFIRCEDLPLET